MNGKSVTSLNRGTTCPEVDLSSMLQGHQRLLQRAIHFSEHTLALARAGPYQGGNACCASSLMRPVCACRIMKEKVVQLRVQLELRRKRLKPKELHGDEGLKAGTKRQKQTLGDHGETGEPAEGGKDGEDRGRDDATEEDTVDTAGGDEDDGDDEDGEDDDDIDTEELAGMGPSFDWRAKQV